LAYASPGIREIPDGRLLPDLCIALIAAGGGPGVFEASIRNALSDKSCPISPNQFVTSIIEEQVAGIGRIPTGNVAPGPFGAGQPGAVLLQRFIFRLLHQLKILERYPCALEYRRVPELDWEQVIDACMSHYVVWPTGVEVKLERMRFEAFKSYIPRIIRHIAHQHTQRVILSGQLRNWLGHIADQIAKGVKLGPAEQSFFLAFSDQSLDRSMTTEERARGAALGAIAASQNDSMITKEAWDVIYTKRVESGPASKYWRFLSNMTRENLTYYLGPQVAELSVAYGQTKPLSYFQEFQMEVVERIPWDLKVQLAAARDRYAAVGLAARSGSGTPASAYFSVPVAIASPAGTARYSPSFDEADIEIRFAGGRTGVVNANEYDIEFYSRERGRMISTGEGFTENAYIIEKALYEETSGLGQTAALDLKGWPLIDIEASPTIKPLIKRIPTFIETMFLPDVKSRTVIRQQVDMSDFYSRLGLTAQFSAFMEYVLPPNSWLKTPDLPAESFIMSRLSLNREARFQAEEAIRLSHNAAKLTRYFGAGNMPPLRVEDAIRAHAGF